MPLRASILLLPSRLILFFAFQLIISLVLGSFELSIKYWLLAASATNLVSILILITLLKSAGSSYSNLFHVDRTMLKNDLLMFSAVALLSIPLVLVPDYLLRLWLWRDASIPHNFLFQPISPAIAYLSLLVFPVTIALAELPTYFGYIMRQLKQNKYPIWLSIFLPVAFLSLQHCTLPFIADFRFIAYRGLMYLPFAAGIGITLHFRPRLFPYFVVLHGLLDLGTSIVLLDTSIGDPSV